MTDEERARVAPIQMPTELKRRIETYARDHGEMSFAAAVRYLLDRALREEAPQP